MDTLLVLGYVWPEPNSSAAGWRMLALLKLFRQKGWRVIFASPAEQGLHRVNLPELGIEEQQVQLNDSSFDQQLQRWQPQVVMFDRFMLEEQFGWRVAKVCPDALRLLDTEDLHFLRQARQQAYKAQRPVTQADLSGETAQREVAAIYRSDLSLIISEAELQLLQQQFAVPQSLLHYCPFWFDQPPAAAPAFDERRNLVFIGNFRHEPNWQAVLWLKKLWPALRQRLPGVELHIYGAYPPPKATQLHAPKQGFFIKGWAQDAQLVLQQARLLLAPLPFGAGLKGKLVEAMRTGTPSVTTRVGAEGIADSADWPGAVAEDEDSLISAVVALYQQKALWQHKQQQGYALVQHRFGAGQAELFWQRLTQLLQHLPAHRLNNFTGAMLNLHHQRSTQYMAQWIEAKTALAALKQEISS
ncbi:glycosyltransferase [Rheinheimera sp.]|uniref:glycosyltransferase n=1 Tax=Rheinheimera sp. TaxID=1869214 RepID=UPI00307F14DB